MHYYKRHLGDYAKDTGHLSALEHGVYTLMLDRYYSTERPIPKDEAYRVARSRTKDEQAAVDSVLREFFKLIDDEWHHSYADRVIAHAQEVAGKNRNNGLKGGRPVTQTEPKQNPNETHSVISGLSEKTLSITPLSNSHKPVSQEGESAPLRGRTRKASKRPPDDFAVDSDMHVWAVTEHPGVDIATETAKFRDHTFATARSDWPATWRNWIRRAAENRKGASHGRQTPGQILTDGCASAFDGRAGGGAALSALRGDLGPPLDEPVPVAAIAHRG